MSFSLPNPTSPTNGNPLDATPILANFVAIAQAIAAFDGSQINAGSIVAASLVASANPNTLLAAITSPFVASGCLWSISSGLVGVMSGGTIYYNGIPVTINSIGSYTFTASKDTYIDIDKNGNVTYQAVSNNASSPSLTANSIRVAIVVAGASISSINTGSLQATAPVVSGVTMTGSDSNGNLIYPCAPLTRTLGYRYYGSGFTIGSGSGNTAITGLSVPIIVPPGRNIKITVHARDVTNNSTGLSTLEVWDGTVGSGTLLTQTLLDTTTAHLYQAADQYYTLSSGLHTLNASLQASANNVTLEAYSFIAIELV
jgi:hypothetical protein